MTNFLETSKPALPDSKQNGTLQWHYESEGQRSTISFPLQLLYFCEPGLLGDNNHKR